MEQKDYKALPFYMEPRGQNITWREYALLEEELADGNAQDMGEIMVELYLSVLSGYTVEHPIILHHASSHKKSFFKKQFDRYRNPVAYSAFRNCLRTNHTSHCFFTWVKSQGCIDKIIHLVNYPKEEEVLKAYLDASLCSKYQLFETCLVNGYLPNTHLNDIQQSKLVIQIDTHDPAKDGFFTCFIRIDSTVYPEEQLIERIRTVMEKHGRKLIMH